MSSRNGGGEVQRMNERLSQSHPREVLEWAHGRYNDTLVLASSFGAEDVILIDMISQITDQPRVFFLDTGRLHQETYETVERCRAKYGLEIEVFFPQTQAVQDLVRSKGPNSFYASPENRKECCRIRKVEPLSRALATANAWVTGLRRSQSQTRTELPLVEVDYAHGGIVKINPLVGWSEEQVWRYIRTNDAPYNALHDQGFPSIGCAPCTRAVQPGEDLRGGRWWWELPEQKECGLHIKDGEVVRK